MSPVNLALTATGLHATRQNSPVSAVAGPVVLIVLGLGWLVPVTVYCAYGRAGLAALAAATAVLAVLILCDRRDSRTRTADRRRTAFIASFTPDFRPLGHTLADENARDQAFHDAGLWAPQWVEIRPTRRGAVLTIAGVHPGQVAARRAELAAALGIPADAAHVQVRPVAGWTQVCALHVTAR
ncbi:hypothetical protein ACFROC_36830 [Nocardia tengchongensis]|uniref:hypothetical protein n=1 Tax=Nocardia tengchongensis TaxID=2055889 RepID=UPI0036CFC5F2